MYFRCGYICELIYIGSWIHIYIPCRTQKQDKIGCSARAPNVTNINKCNIRLHITPVRVTSPTR